MHDGENSPPAGILYGIGVGPGAPDLLTLRAVDALRKVDVVLAAASPRNEHSLALGIAAPHLPAGVRTLRLDFPMTRDGGVLEKAWNDNADQVAAILRAGHNAAFLTLGDPLIYSTFGYLMRTLQKKASELPVEVVPGVTSFQAGAARTRTVLCEGSENLVLISGINGRDELRAALSGADSAVILKAYKNFAGIRRTLEEAGRAEDCLFVSRLGLSEEKIVRGLADAPEAPHYLSLILAAPKRGSGE